MRNSVRLIFWALVVLLVAAVLLWRGHPFRPKKLPNVIVILIDTLRADHLGAYGYWRNTSPNIDAFAKESIKFSRAISASNWTPTSVATLFTGLYPTTHGLSPDPDRLQATKRAQRLSTCYMTFPILFQGLGYETMAVSSNPWIGPAFGFDVGFDSFKLLNRLDGDKVVASAKKAMERYLKSSSEKPFLLYLHFMDPHNPYSPHPASTNLFLDDPSAIGFPYLDRMKENIRLYDGEILNVDTAIGDFFQYLRERGLYDDTRIILLADHGEQFAEHGKLGHGLQLHQEELHVPLLVKVPGQSRTDDTLVSNIDVLPTLFDVVGVSKPEALPGISLLDTTNLEKRRGVFSEFLHHHAEQAFSDVRNNRVIYDLALDEELSRPHIGSDGEPVRALNGLFNFATDKFEQAPLVDPGLEQYLKTQLITAYDGALRVRQTCTAAAAAGSSSEESSSPVNAQVLQQLRSLGYFK